MRRDWRQHKGIDARFDDRSACGQVVGRRSGWRGDDQPVGTDVRDEFVAHKHRQIDEPRSRGLVDDDVVDGDLHLARRRAHRGCCAEHQPLFDAGTSRQSRVERRIQLRSVTSVRKPRLPKFTPRIGTRRPEVGDAVGHAEKRAVAAEHQHEPDTFDKRLFIGDGAAGRRRHQRRRRRLEYRRDAVAGKPGLDVHQVRRRRLETRLGDNAHVSNRSLGLIFPPRPAF